VNFGNYHFNNSQEWARRLKSPKTGISLGVTDFGQRDSIGYAFTLMPYIEFNAFGLEDFMIKVGTGGSVFTTKYDPVTNPLNEGITTDIVWSFRAFAHYRIIEAKKTHWFLGAGYFHHSNGHTRLPNQGLNSFLLSLSAEFTKGNTQVENRSMPTLMPSTYSYASIRSGFGYYPRPIIVRRESIPYLENTGRYSIIPTNLVLDCTTDYINITTIILRITNFWFGMGLNSLILETIHGLMPLISDYMYLARC